MPSGEQTARTPPAERRGRVSFIVIAFNEQNSIRRCLESILRAALAGGGPGPDGSSRSRNSRTGRSSHAEKTLARRLPGGFGYFTWVEQQGVAVEDFTRRRSRDLWTGLKDLLPAWDGMIEEFNRRTGLVSG